MRLVPDDVDAAGFAFAVSTGPTVSWGLGDSRAGSGDGGPAGAAGLSDGAGMTVTTADGAEARRLGEGEGLAEGLAGALAAWLRLGDGSGGGGMMPVGEGEGSTRAGLADGWGAAGLAFAVLVAFGVGVGAGAANGCASADPTRMVGVTTTAATDSSSERRTSGTRRL